MQTFAQQTIGKPHAFMACMSCVMSCYDVISCSTEGLNKAVTVCQSIGVLCKGLVSDLVVGHSNWLQ